MRRPNNDITSEPFPPLNSNRPRELLPSILSTTPPSRSSTLPPLQRHGINRPRKQSVSKRAREPQHKRQKSRDQIQMRRMSYDRKAFSAEPSNHLSAYGKRWEDLIDAATSATEDVDEDRTPVSTYTHIKIQLMGSRCLHRPIYLNHRCQLTGRPCLRSRPLTSKAIRHHPSSRRSPHLLMYKKRRSPYHRLRVTRAETTFTSIAVAYLTHHQASPQIAFKYIVLRVKGYHS